MSCLAGLNPALHGAVAPRTSARMTSSSRKSSVPPLAAFGGGAPRAFTCAGRWKLEGSDGLVAHRGNLPLPAPRGRANPSKSTRTAATAPAGEGVGQDAYNKAMAEYSKTPFEYRHELGLYYHFILPNLIVGTQPQTREDIDRLKDVEGVTCMFDTQQDKDKDHWGVDFGAIKDQMNKRGVLHVHKPFVDFNADSLRLGLPSAVAQMDKVLREGHTVYCHCTAGMGRSPGVAIGYLYWCLNFDNLDQAYDFLTSKRPCGPKKESIRAATIDMLRAGEGNLPDEHNGLVHSEDPEGTAIDEYQRWDIVTKLRRSVGDDPMTCVLSPLGQAKKMLGFELTADDCS